MDEVNDYGDVTDGEIYLCSNIGIGQVPEDSYTYELGAEAYGTGTDYILVTERIRSVIYDHGRYILDTNLLLCENSQEYNSSAFG